MNRRWFPYLTVFLLLGLLALLATLQYRWLGQISDAESVRLKQRLTDDTSRFARDFDQEIQNAFFTLQSESKDLDEAGQSRFFKKFLYWKRKAVEPDLVKNVFLIRENKPEELTVLDQKNGAFIPSKLPADFTPVKKAIDSKSKSMSAIGNYLMMPLLGESNDFQKLILRTNENKKAEVVEERLIGGPPDVTGFLVIEINRDVVKERVLPRLVDKYFKQDGSGSFEVTVKDETGSTFFSTGEKGFDKGDATKRFFSLRPGDFTFFARNAGNVLQEEVIEGGSNRDIPAKTGQIVKQTKGRVLSVNLEGSNTIHSRVSIFDEDLPGSNGQWVLNIRHTSGSLEQFVSNTRNRNLAISFGILSILALGMILIVVSTQRARTLATRQLEFVSSVSHEFRTPLAVIYSAGENISDGVVEDREKLSAYGEMIKREGSRLSAMVEQILEYAGANSRRRSYDFEDADIAGLVETSIAECMQVAETKGFEIERDIPADLPRIQVDKLAFVQSIQNLIANSLKYCNGSKWIKVSAEQFGNGVRISVEDRGIGISSKDLKHIFEPFYRSKDVVDEQISGNGLGLSLVKEIADAHDGRVSVVSEPDKGSTFSIWFPFSR